MDTDERRLFFMHIPKTAGTALKVDLDRQYGNAIYPAPSDGSDEGVREYLRAYMSVDLLRDHLRQSRGQVRLIAGHFPLCVADLLDVPLTVFTVLRDPVERTLSLLRRHRQSSVDYGDASLEEIYADPWLFKGTIHNFTVKMLGMTVAELKNPNVGIWNIVPDDDDRLERARHSLVHRVDLFGLQEDFNAFCAELSRRYGFELVQPGRVNESVPAEASDELRERIAHDNAQDVELYRFAREVAADRLGRRR